MADIKKVILPNPRDKHEIDLYNVIDTFINTVNVILDAGIIFGDNVDCDLVTFTTDATPDTEDTTAHSLGKVPTGFIVYSQDKAGSLYNSGTAFTSSNIYTKCDVASVEFKIIVF